MQHTQKKSQVLLGIVGFLCVSEAAMAAGNAANIAAADVSRSMAAQERAMKAPLMPLASPTAGLPKKPSATHQPQDEGANLVRFVLKGINVEGNTAVSIEELKSSYSGIIGKEIALSEVYKIAEEMEVIYRLKGFEYSRVLVPAQKSSGGIIKLVVVETAVGRVKFEGETHGRQDILEGVREKILASKPLRNADLERYVLLLNDIPGISAVAELSKSDMENMTDVTFRLKEKPIDIAFIVDNSRVEKLGTYQGTGILTLNNTLGLYEKLTITGSSDKEFKKMYYVKGALSTILNAEGTQATLSGMYSGTDQSISTLTIEGKTKAFDLAIMHPFVRTRAMNLRLNGGFSYRDADTTTGEFKTPSNFRSLTLGTTFDLADAAAGVTLLNLDAELGLDAFSATASSVKDAVSGKYDNSSVFVNNFRKVNGTITRQQTIPGIFGLSLTASVTGQYSFDPLPGEKTFSSFGGREYGRGLDANLMSADNGFAGKLELHYTKAFDMLKDQADSFLIKTDPYLFGEYGRAWNRDDKMLTLSRDAFLVQTNEDTLSAFTVGGGVKVDVDAYASLYGEVAWVLSPSKALQRKFESAAPTASETAQKDGTVRFFFGATLRY